MVCDPDFVYMLFFFFFNDTATTEIYTLSLHDALPISLWLPLAGCLLGWAFVRLSLERGFALAVAHHFAWKGLAYGAFLAGGRSEEHTSELQSRQYLVCRLLLEKKKNIQKTQYSVNVNI